MTPTQVRPREDQLKTLKQQLAEKAPTAEGTVLGLGIAQPGSGRDGECCLVCFTRNAAGMKWLSDAPHVRSAEMSRQGIHSLTGEKVDCSTRIKREDMRQAYTRVVS